MRNRNRITVIFFLVLLYFLFFHWFAVPPVAYSIGWEPKTTLRVMSVVEESYQEKLQPNDIITAVEGNPVQRGSLIFPLPRQSSYQLTIVRDGVSENVDIITPERPTIFIWWKIAMTLLSVAFWGIGYLFVRFAREGAYSELYAGLCFQMLGCSAVSGGPAQHGLFGAWIVGDVLIFTFPFIIVSLAYLPIVQPLSKQARRILLLFLGVITFLVMLATVEVLFLFPETTLKLTDTITLGNSLVILTGGSLIWAIGVLLYRVLRSPSHSYQRQQLQILWVCLFLAVLPLLLAVILPYGQDTFPPYPLVFAFLLFMPAGYFFVLQRKNMLKLDTLFGRIIIIVITILILFIAYAASVATYETLANVQIGTFVDRGFFLLSGTIGVAAFRPLQTWIDALLYGREQLGKEVLTNFTNRLAKNPTLSTLGYITEQLSLRLNCQNVVIIIEDGESVRSIVKNSQCNDVILQAETWRVENPPSWTGMTIPITIESEKIGFLLLSQPTGHYFNLQHSRQLHELSAVLASFVKLLLLFDKREALAERVLFERKLQQKKLATFLHNVPIQDLIGVLYLLKPGISTQQLSLSVAQIKAVITGLRNMSTELQPAALDKSLRWMMTETVRSFKETHSVYDTTLDLNLTNESAPPEAVMFAVHTILTESLANIFKHAQADQIQVSLLYDSEILALTIEDNGIGFKDIPSSSTEMFYANHIGLADMNSWAKLVGGKFTVANRKPTGTQLLFTIPVSRFSSVPT